MIKQKAGWMFAGALVSLLGAWPVVSSLAALTWPGIVLDADGPDIIAANRITSANRGLIYLSTDDQSDVPKEILGQDCVETLREAWTLAHPETRDIASLWTVIVQRRTAEDQRAAELVARSALVELSHPSLGALTGCIEGSLLSVLCSRWASQRIDHAMRSHRAELTASFAENSARMQRVACQALSGVRGKSD